MQTASLRKVAAELGISMEHLVSYQRKGNKALIEVDLQFQQPEAGDQSEPDVFSNILAMSENLGINDWAVNHDHYLYGTSKRGE